MDQGVGILFLFLQLKIKLEQNTLSLIFRIFFVENGDEYLSLHVYQSKFKAMQK